MTVRFLRPVHIEFDEAMAMYEAIKPRLPERSADRREMTGTSPVMTYSSSVSITSNVMN
ncbi:MAG TPA: hypothetical protein VLR47_13775 [Rhodospirillales bacterium]|nr:hypothetical protein [Rhodospirillales bacterium]